MPWNKDEPVFERRFRFIKMYETGHYTITELSHHFGVCRNNAYKWVRRYREEGAEGLLDRRRTPHNTRRTPPEVEAAVLALRDKHPYWGAKKLKRLLELHQPHREWPSKSCIGDILKRHGRVQVRQKRRKWAHPGKPVVSMDAPNQVWCADYKGHFRLGTREYCYPLTVSDGCSRYLLGCEGLTGTDTQQAQAVFHRLFEEYGLPEYILTDNGSPFASAGMAGLSRLSVWWIRLGIIPKRTQPSSPQQNGRHERMHRTLKAEATRPPSPTMTHQQARFDAFRHEYNDVRPHEALGMNPPAELYMRSPRRFPDKLPRLEYPNHAVVRKVSTSGSFRWKSDPYVLNVALAGQYVGLEEVDDGLWSVYFGPVLVARLNERTQKIV